MSRLVDDVVEAFRGYSLMREALEELQRLGEEGMKPDYAEWLTFHDKVAKIARDALARLQPSPSALPRSGRER
jgi:hypothetical protein